MQTPTYNWPDTERSKHALLLAQFIEESLSERNFETFRAPALDNRSRLYEIASEAITNRKSSKPLTNFTPMVEEIRSTTKGSIFSEIFLEDLKIVEDLLTNFDSKSKAQLQKVSNRIRIILENSEKYYLIEMKKVIQSDFKNSRSKIAARRDLREFISFLINDGYDKRFIFHHCRDVFFSRKFKKFNSNISDRFLKRFDSQDRAFLVYVPVQNSCRAFFEAISSTFGSVEALNAVPLKLRNRIRNDDAFSEKDVYYIKQIKCRDAFAAVHKVIRTIERQAATSVIDSKGLSVPFRPYAFAFDKSNSELTSVQSAETNLQNTSNHCTKAQAKRIISDGDDILNNFNPISRRQIISSNETVSLVRSANDSETQLSIVWSAFESLLGDPLDLVSRSSHYIDKIVPAVCLNYPWRYANAIYQQLHIHHRKLVIGALNEAEIELSLPDLHRFQNFVFLPQYKDLHRPFLANLQINPVLQFELFLFYRNFSEPKHAKVQMLSHKERVEWQLQRIYRMRNSFVHSGSRNRKSRAIALNSFEYFRTLVSALTFHGAQRAKLNSGSSRNFSINYVSESLNHAYDVRMTELDKMIIGKENDFSNGISFFRRL